MKDRQGEGVACSWSDAGGGLREILRDNYEKVRVDEYMAEFLCNVKLLKENRVEERRKRVSVAENKFW